MIPRRTVDVLRANHNTSIDIYGIDCSLYIPTNLNTIENMDLYHNPDDYAFDAYSCLVWIEFSPDSKRLRKLGIFAEDETPMICRFPTEATIVSEDTDNGDTEDIDVPIGAYFKVSMEYVPSSVSDTDEFEVVDIRLGNAHDAILSKIYVIAPRRV